MFRIHPALTGFRIGAMMRLGVHVAARRKGLPTGASSLEDAGQQAPRWSRSIWTFCAALLLMSVVYPTHAQDRQGGGVGLGAWDGGGGGVGLGGWNGGGGGVGLGGWREDSRGSPGVFLDGRELHWRRRVKGSPLRHRGPP